jgi:hypothetical protein
LSAEKGFRWIEDGAQSVVNTGAPIPFTEGLGFCSLTTYSLNGESSEEPLGAQRHNAPASHWPSNPLDWRGCRVEGRPRPGLQEDPGSWVLETPVPKARGSVPHPLRALVFWPRPTTTSRSRWCRHVISGFQDLAPSSSFFSSLVACHTNITYD